MYKEYKSIRDGDHMEMGCILPDFLQIWSFFLFSHFSEIWVLYYLHIWPKISALGMLQSDLG